MGTDVPAAAWRKSRRSGNNGGSCVETALLWRKSARSGNNGGECVETAAAGRQVAVRDSKAPEGGRLQVSARGWERFAHAVKDGNL